MKIGYARVSTTGQDLSLQISALESFGCERIFYEKKSAVKEREELDKVMLLLREGDVLVVWKLDRLARSIQQLLLLISKLEDMKVDLVCVNGAVDTTTPHGRLLFHVTSAFAQFERDLIVERTMAGLAEARKKGVQLGRRAGLSPEALEKAKVASELYSSRTVPQICSVLKISKSTLYRYLAKMGVELKNNVGRPKK